MLYKWLHNITLTFIFCVIEDAFKISLSHADGLNISFVQRIFDKKLHGRQTDQTLADENTS